MKKPVNFLHWLPRILCIAVIIFLGMFSLDVFSPGTPLWRQAGGFLIHNIPSLIILLFLIFSWKNEYAGGIVFIATGIIASVLIFIMNYRRTGSDIGQSLLTVLLIGFPFIVIGILFLTSYFNKKKSAPAE